MIEEPENTGNEELNNLEGIGDDPTNVTSERTENLPAKAEPKKQLVARKDGALIGSTLDEQYRLAVMYVSSGMVPKHYKRPEQVITAMQYAVGVGLPPTLPSLRNICVINGQPELWGELPLKIVRETGELEKIDEYLIDVNEERIKYVQSWEMIFASVCVIKRHGRPEKTYNWTRWQAEQAIHGLEVIWKGYYDVMMKRKCRAIALKDEFGDVLGGARISEYDSHNAPDLPSIKDVVSSASDSQSDLDAL